MIYFELCLRFTVLQVLRSKTFLYFFGIWDRDFTAPSLGFICFGVIIYGFTYCPFYIFADTGNESTSDTVPCHFVSVYCSLQLLVIIIFPLFFFLSLLLFWTSYYCPYRINSVINIFPEFASPTHQNPSALSHRLFVFFSSISSQTLTKEQKFNINHRKIKKYEKMEMVIDKLPRYQEFEQVLGNITRVNKFLNAKKSFMFFLQTCIKECIIDRSFLFVPVFHMRKLRACFPWFWTMCVRAYSYWK